MPGRCRPGLCGRDLGSAVTASFHVGSATQPERASPCRRPDRPRQWNTAEPRCGRALPCGCAATVLWSWRSETVPSGTNLAALRLTGDRKEHTSELQSRGHLVCRLLLEKKKKKNTLE